MTMTLLEQIREAAGGAGVDPDLFAALVRQESGGDPNARSPVGAIGYTQLMPPTAAELGVDPHDPVQNLQGGARYLRQQLDAFGGDRNRALQAYHSGAGNVQRGRLGPNGRAYPGLVQRYVGQPWPEAAQLMPDGTIRQAPAPMTMGNMPGQLNPSPMDFGGMPSPQRQVESTQVFDVPLEEAQRMFAEPPGASFSGEQFGRFAGQAAQTQYPGWGRPAPARGIERSPAPAQPSAQSGMALDKSGILSPRDEWFSGDYATPKPHEPWYTGPLGGPDPRAGLVERGDTMPSASTPIPLGGRGMGNMPGQLNPAPGDFGGTPRFPGDNRPVPPGWQSPDDMPMPGMEPPAKGSGFFKPEAAMLGPGGDIYDRDFSKTDPAAEAALQYHLANPDARGLLEERQREEMRRMAFDSIRPQEKPQGGGWGSLVESFAAGGAIAGSKPYERAMGMIDDDRARTTEQSRYDEQQRQRQGDRALGILQEDRLSRPQPKSTVTLPNGQVVEANDLNSILAAIESERTRPQRDEARRLELEGRRSDLGYEKDRGARDIRDATLQESWRREQSADRDAQRENVSINNLMSHLLRGKDAPSPQDVATARAQAMEMLGIKSGASSAMPPPPPPVGVGMLNDAERVSAKQLGAEIP